MWSVSQRLQLSRITLSGCSFDVFIFVFGLLSIMPCLLITLIKYLKIHMSVEGMCKKKLNRFAISSDRNALLGCCNKVQSQLHKSNHHHHHQQPNTRSVATLITFSPFLTQQWPKYKSQKKKQRPCHDGLFLMVFKVQSHLCPDTSWRMRKEQIHFKFWTITLSDLDKYILKCWKMRKEKNTF